MIENVRVGDDQMLKMKAKIAFRLSKDSLRVALSSDCSMCPSVLFGVATWIGFIRYYRLTKVDVGTLFNQAVQNRRDFHIFPDEK